MRTQSSVEIDVRTATGDEKQCCFLFVCLYFCMFVTLDVQDRRGLDVQQRIMSPFVEQFQCSFHCFSQKETSFPTVCRDFNYITGVTIFDGIGENLEKFSKTNGKVCEHEFDHLGAAYNKSFIRPLCYRIIDVHLNKFFR